MSWFVVASWLLHEFVGFGPSLDYPWLVTIGTATDAMLLTARQQQAAEVCRIADHAQHLQRLQQRRHRCFETDLPGLHIRMTRGFTHHLTDQVVAAEDIKQRREHALRLALDHVPCMDADIAFLIFQGDVQLNAAGVAVLVDEKTRKHVPLVDGLKAAMPDYLTPATLTGGSGTAGGHTRRISPLDRQLEGEKSKLQTLKQRYAKSGGSSHVLHEISQQLKIVKVLEEMKKRRKH